MGPAQTWMSKPVKCQMVLKREQKAHQTLDYVIRSASQLPRCYLSPPYSISSI
jgi:hypothetical protein